MLTNSSDLSPALDDDNTLCIKDIASHCKEYKGADTKRSVFQLITTLALFMATCTVMYLSIDTMYWLTALLTVPAAGLLIRIFIFQHDCGHGSFFNSKALNTWVGRFLGILTVTPYDFWRRAHNMHHATSGNLDQRSIGGIDTLTVAEYKALSPAKRALYRIYRNPVVLLVFGTPFHVMILQRLPIKYSTQFHEGYKTLPPSSIWKSIMTTNLAIAVFFGSLAMMIGVQKLALLYLPILIVTSWIGGWLFYIQHQFEDAYWENRENWNVQDAALMGSSYYDLPKILQWFTGNIGLHHIHHLCSTIPNYKLQQCMDDRPELKHINRLTFMESLGCLKFKLWDEDKKQLVESPS